MPPAAAPPRRPSRAAPRPPAPAARRPLRVAAALRAPSKRQICCSKTLVAKPGAEDEVLRLAADAARFGRGRAAERGSGVVAFDVMRDAYEPNVVHFWERYESNAALGRHNTTPEAVRFMEQVVPLLERPVGMALYEWQDGKIGPACMQGGPKGEGGLDDATGASGAAGGASMKQTSRAFDLGGIEAAHLAETDEVFGMPEFKRHVEQQFSKQLDSFKAAVGGLGRLFGRKG